MDKKEKELHARTDDELDDVLDLMEEVQAKWLKVGTIVGTTEKVDQKIIEELSWRKSCVLQELGRRVIEKRGEKADGA